MKLTTKSLFSTLPKDATSLLPRLQDEKTRKYTTLVLTLIAIIFFGFFAINPTLGTIAELRKHLEDNQYVDQQLVTKIANLSSLQQRYTQIQPDLPIILTAIPTSPTMSYFFGQIQSLASDNNIQITRIQSFPVEIGSLLSPTTKYTSFAFVVDISGTYTDVINFLNALSDFNRVIVIDGITITKPSPTNQTIRANVKGKAFFKRT